MVGEYTGGTYYDHLEQERNYTFIDHSKKTKLSGFVPDGSATEQHRKDRAELIKKILEYPASLCPFEFNDFTKREEGLDNIQWREEMVQDEGVDFFRLLDLKMFLGKRAEQINNPY